ncbi:MAG: DEAD/DEAH box helicase [Eubacterium sp.]|nr:DEAD/DEAH box helicase [Eubacterium sp.]
MIYLSVGDMLEMTVRSGSIDTRFTSRNRAVQGTRLHQKLQKRHIKSAAEAGLAYESEVTIKTGFSYRNYDFMLMGRIDGLVKADKKIVIEEIKSTTANLEDIEEPLAVKHLAQAKIYGYMYGENYGKKNFEIYLTYCDLKGNEKSLIYSYSFKELKEYFFEILESYYKWTEINEQLIAKRDMTLEVLKFPYESFRNGQRELSVAVYKTLVSGKKMFASAPTGIGKTLGTIFPTLKYMAKKGDKPKRAFYLTSKNTIKALAENALSFMEEKGLFIVSVTLTAKEKICLNSEVSCNPVKCSYARGHFDRVNDALWEIINNETVITGDTVREYAKQHRVCPFELALDLTNFAHFIICDYNYAFDPSAKLCRFFDEDRNEEYIALIDEAHNLPSRSREMYSAEIYKSEVLAVKRALKGSSAKLSSCLNSINSYLLREKAGMEGELVSKSRDSGFIHLLNDFIQAADRWLVRHEGSSAYDLVLDFYFKAMDYVKADDYFDRHFVVIKESWGKELKKTIFCRDASEILRGLEENFKSIVFFTATFKPMDYFIEVLGGDSKKDNKIEIPSPFPRENLCVITDNSISTVYKDRENSYIPIAERIFTLKNAKRGNYICFFPSYEYMERVYEAYTDRYGAEGSIIQKKGFTEEDRAGFLDDFKENSAVIGFCVLGGVFSEGIDLKGSRLIGCAVVGVGLPKVAVKQNVIKEYYDSEKKDGFAYAYAYPGMIKAAQAGGRVIRAKDDRGVILLLDRRFSTDFYKSLLPSHWQGGYSVFGSQSISRILKYFWK